jgi:predicted nuclease with TOPRIM domain
MFYNQQVMSESKPMNKTNVDDILIEMISPKVKEIEERFSRGEGLNNEDINTLLLKSQYNHISHLDQRLDEVTASVQGLEEKFSGLEGKFAGLEGKFSGLEGKFAGLEGKFELIKTDLEGKFALLKSDIETTIQTALNKNMLQLITVMGMFVIVSKIIDKF